MTESKKKILHILLTKPDEKQDKLMKSISQGNYPLYYELGASDITEYDYLVDLIFEYEQVITWW